jgi:dienelactone hydrolase
MEVTMKHHLLLGLALLFSSAMSLAQNAGAQLAFDATGAVDLTFPDTATPIADATTPRMMLMRPEGAGPFPAVALGHQCGGLIFSKSNPNAVNWSMLNWAKTFVKNGYVTLLVDFMDARGAKTLCSGPNGGVTYGRAVKDFMQAAEYLRKQPDVDPDRVAMVGFSQGAILALFSNSKDVREKMNVGKAYNAYVSFYPLCGYTRNGPGNYAGEIVQDDIDRPHLIFTGGLDNETPFEDCQKRLKPLIERGKPITYRHYDEATHCFDC